MSNAATMARNQNEEMLRQSGKMRTMLWILLIFIVVVIITVLSITNNNQRNPIPDDSKQMIAVRTPSWTASKGILQRYERYNKADWTPVGAPAPVILGRNGMGWGRGLHQIPNDGNPVKHEGDGKSPAGVFRFGDAFGFPSPEEIGDLHIPYKPVDEYLECIDDIDSQYYNKLVENNTVDVIDWESSEHIQRSPNAYHFGLVVEHNTADTQKGAGSCIFLHCVSVDGDSTAGCTTIERAEMEKIVKWLNADDDPVLVQLPESEYTRLKDQWNLPD